MTYHSSLARPDVVAVRAVLVVQVAGVRRFNTAITLSPLFELLNARFKLHEKEELVSRRADSPCEVVSARVQTSPVPPP